MSFKPEKENHALVEAIFAFQLNRPWTPKMIENVRNGREAWSEFLPRMNEIHLQEIVLGSNGPRMLGDSERRQSSILPANGLVFERIKPDGTVAWRLGCERTSLTVNCLDYTKWAEVWETVLRLVSQVVHAAGSQDSVITEFHFRTIDVFAWDGALDSYNASLLLDATSDCVPARIKDNGLIWHLHQGWFEDFESPVEGNVLNRVHFDAFSRDNRHLVKMDTEQKFTLKTPELMTMLIGNNESVAAIFDWLHKKNKEILRNFLTDDATVAIGLIDGGEK